MNKPKLLFIFPGPKYHIKHTLGKRFELLSKKYTGIIFTSTHGNDCTQLSDFVVKTVPYYHHSKFINYSIYLLALLKIAYHQKKEKIDIVISYDPLFTGFISYIISKYLNAKLILEVNGDFAHPAIYKEQKSKILAAIKKSSYKIIAKFVIYKSHGVKLLYKSQINWINMDAYNGKIYVGPDFVDIEPFLNSTGKYKETNTILVIGFPFYIKGIDIIINAFRMIETEFPEWSLKILGWYPNPEKIKELIGESTQIQLLAPVHHSEMTEKIGTTKIIAQPSRTEAMGRALVEASAAGKAIVASNVGGIPTVVIHNRTGLLVEPENTNELALNLRLLMDNEDLRCNFGAAARKHAQDYNSVENYFRNNNEFYQNVLKL